MHEGPLEEGSDSFERLQALQQAGNMDRLEKAAREALGRDPEDPDALFHLGVALIELERLKEARRVVDTLLELQPEECNSHLLALHYYLRREHWVKMEGHARAGMRIDPDFPAFHYYAALQCTARMKREEALLHIRRARELEPNDADIANLELYLKGNPEESVAATWQRVHDYQAALALDPGHADLHVSLGTVHLEFLDQPAQAEPCFRTALRLDPRHHRAGQLLFQAVARRSLLYRLLSLPQNGLGALFNVLRAARYRPQLILSLLFGLPAVVLYLFWLFWAFLLLWPGCKIYEWLLVSQIKLGKRTSNQALRLRSRFHRLPLGLRFALFAVLLPVLWASLFKLIKVPYWLGFLWVGLFIILNLIVLVAHRIERRRQLVKAQASTAHSGPAPQGPYRIKR